MHQVEGSQSVGRRLTSVSRASQCRWHRRCVQDSTAETLPDNTLVQQMEGRSEWSVDLSFPLLILPFHCSYLYRSHWRRMPLTFQGWSNLGSSEPAARKFTTCTYLTFLLAQVHLLHYFILPLHLRHHLLWSVWCLHIHYNNTLSATITFAQTTHVHQRHITGLIWAI